MTASERFERWLKEVKDPALKAELLSLRGNEAEILERFYGDLAFGTAGLRGVLGAGSARMNIYTVGKATQGFAAFLAENYTDPSVVIAYDSRIMSLEFSRLCAVIFAANGVKTYLYDELQPTPVLSFSVRHLRTSGGVMITASHNPSDYNGYKAYDPEGCQLSVEDSERVTDYIDRVDIFGGVKTGSFDSLAASGMIKILGSEIPKLFTEAVFGNSIHPDIFKDSGLRIAYTPLHGTGKKPMCAMFDRLCADYVLVASQAEPDGNFPTCSYPNPEYKEALAEGLKTAREHDCDILIASDPDADRLAVAVKDDAAEGGYRHFTGNELGCLMLDYICRERLAQNTMPSGAIAVKTIVTTDMVNDIAKFYGITAESVYTGFKYICTVATELARKGGEHRFLMGFEESCGYTIGTHVRDKDSISGAMIVCEMAALYKKLGSSLSARMDALYAQFGCHLNLQKSFTFEGVDGMKTMANIMTDLRETAPPHETAELATIIDYKSGEIHDLGSNTKSAVNMGESSDVLEFRYENCDKVIVRPSGTEPKIKLYFFVKRQKKPAAEKDAAAFAALAGGLIDKLAKKAARA